MRLPAPSTGHRRQSEVVMIEVKLFLAAFAVLVLAMSALYPMRFARIISSSLANTDAQRLAELYPGVDVVRAHARFLKLYRAANAIILVLGLALLAWFSHQMLQPGWNDQPVFGMVTMYFLLQHVPIVLIAWFTARFNKLHRHTPPQGRRKALLERRGVLDFIPRWTVVLAIVSYIVFVAFMLYVERHPFPGFGGAFANIAIVTLTYVLGAFVMHWMVHRKRKDPLQSHADRMRVIGVVVNCYAWVCVLLPLFASLTIARQLLRLSNWGPFFICVFFLALAVLSLRTLSGLPRQPAAAGHGTSPVQ
jgi:hypothetical protein